MSGWIKIHRDMMNHWCASDPNFLAVWVRLLFDANYEDKKNLINGTVVNIKRGQVLFGLPSFSKRSGVTVAKLRRIISVLIEKEMISRQTTNKYSIISITKYDMYQKDDRQKTNRKQTENKQNTTSKEDNNIRIKEIDTLFDEFWKVYPSNKSKHASKLKYELAIKHISPEDLLQCVIKYADEKSGEDVKYIKHASTWLYQKEYLDYEPEDNNIKMWEYKLEEFKKGKWLEDWGDYPGVNGWGSSTHGECPEELEIRFLAISGKRSDEGSTTC